MSQQSRKKFNGNTKFPERNIPCVVWVIGSGPVNHWPEEKPDMVIYANGGVFQKGNISRNARAEICLTTSELVQGAKASDSAGMVGVKDLLAKYSPYNEIIVRETLRTNPAEGIRLREKWCAKSVMEQMPYRKILKIIEECCGKNFVRFLTFKALGLGSGGRIHWLANYIKNRPRAILNTRYTKISTGVLAVLLAENRFAHHRKVYVLGVTRNSEYAYDSKLRAKRENHLLADELVLGRLLVKRGASRLRIDDPSMNEACKATTAVSSKCSR